MCVRNFMGILCIQLQHRCQFLMLLCYFLYQLNYKQKDFSYFLELKNIWGQTETVCSEGKIVIYATITFFQ